jgi:hypothetical protein
VQSTGNICRNETPRRNKPGAEHRNIFSSAKYYGALHLGEMSGHLVSTNISQLRLP